MPHDKNSTALNRITIIIMCMKNEETMRDVKKCHGIGGNFCENGKLECQLEMSELKDCSIA